MNSSPLGVGCKTEASTYVGAAGRRDLAGIKRIWSTSKAPFGSNLATLEYSIPKEDGGLFVVSGKHILSTAQKPVA